MPLEQPVMSTLGMDRSFVSPRSCLANARAKFQGLRAVARAQRRRGQAVVPGGAGLQLAGAAIAWGSIDVVGQVDRIARRIGSDAPAQFGQRYVVAVVQGQLQWAVGRAVLRGVDNAQLQARQLRRFTIVQPHHPHAHQPQAHSGGQRYGQGFGRVAQQQDQPGDDQENAEEHGDHLE